MLRKIVKLLGSGHAGNDQPEPSRRAFLAGAGAVACTALLLPAFVGAGDAEAAAGLDEAPDEAGPMSLRDDGSYDVAQRYERRYQRRELRRRCRRDRRFRRRNPRLCQSIEYRGGRPGSCVQIGPITVCD